MSRTPQQFFLGETVRVRVSFTDDTDNPVNVSGVNFSVKSPNGAVTSSAAVQVNSHTYYTDVVVNLPGSYAVRATGTTPTSSAVEVQFTAIPSIVL